MQDNLRNPSILAYLLHFQNSADAPNYVQNLSNITGSLHHYYATLIVRLFLRIKEYTVKGR